MLCKNLENLVEPVKISKMPRNDSIIWYFSRESEKVCLNSSASVLWQHTSEDSRNEIGFGSAGASKILASDFSFDKLK